MSDHDSVVLDLLRARTVPLESERLFLRKKLTSSGEIHNKPGREQRELRSFAGATIICIPFIIASATTNE